MPGTASTCVILCHWTGQSTKGLFRLLGQMRRIDAGAPFDVLLVVNGGDLRPLAIPPGRAAGLNLKVFNRVNHGYNIEAWDVGWRMSPGYRHYLFLQSECFLRRKGWVADFEFRMDRDRGIGLLGESFCWEQATWEFIRESTDRNLGPAAWPEGEPAHPIDQFRSHLQEHRIPPGDVGTHLQSIILFTSRAILEEVDGFPLIGTTYRKAVAAEIGMSRKIEAKGYRLARITDRDFAMIGHLQQTWRNQLEMKVRANLRLRSRAGALLKRIGMKR